MQKSLLHILFVFTVILLAGCGSDKKPMDDHQDRAITTDNLGRFNESEWILLRSVNLYDSVPRPELYLWWEQNLGEPFTDLNGNGIYDAGVDSFLVTGTETTDDLNHNGKYDGPNDPWTPGVPFDDLDHDRELRLETRAYQKFWRPGVPWVDFNGNGKWDSLPAFSYDMAVCSTRTIDIGTWYGYFPQDSAWSYTSDSGVTYYVLPHEENDIWFSSPLPFLQFVRTQGRVNYFDAVNGSAIIVPLLDGGVVESDSGDVETSAYYGPESSVMVHRTIRTGQSLTINDTTYERLVLVRLSDYRLGDPTQTNNYRLAFREMYFSPDLGLLALRAKALNDLPVVEYYFDRRYQSLPVAMKS